MAPSVSSGTFPFHTTPFRFLWWAPPKLKGSPPRTMATPSSPERAGPMAFALATATRPTPGAGTRTDTSPLPFTPQASCFPENLCRLFHSSKAKGVGPGRHLEPLGSPVVAPVPFLPSQTSSPGSSLKFTSTLQGGAGASSTVTPCRLLANDAPLRGHCRERVPPG